MLRNASLASCSLLLMVVKMLNYLKLLSLELSQQLLIGEATVRVPLIPPPLALSSYIINSELLYHFVACQMFTTIQRLIVNTSQIQLASLYLFYFSNFGHCRSEWEKTDSKNLLLKVLICIHPKCISGVCRTTEKSIIDVACLSTLTGLVISPMHHHTHTQWSTMRMQKCFTAEDETSLIFNPHLPVTTPLVLAAWDSDPKVWLPPVISCSKESNVWIAGAVVYNGAQPNLFMVCSVLGDWNHCVCGYPRVDIGTNWATLTSVCLMLDFIYGHTSLRKPTLQPLLYFTKCSQKGINNNNTNWIY